MLYMYTSKYVPGNYHMIINYQATCMGDIDDNGFADESALA